MYIHDSSPYCYDLPKPLESVLAVGWLTKSEPIQTGDCPTDVIEKIKRLILRESVNQTRGTHSCDFCGEDRIRLNVRDRTFLLGAAELWVPDDSGRIAFAAPNLIVHYIVKHRYLPPTPFLDAVRAFSEDSTWRGQLLYERLSAQAYG